MKHDYTCNTTGFCEGKVLYFSGSKEKDNLITENMICDAHFGGITIIGSSV